MSGRNKIFPTAGSQTSIRDCGASTKGYPLVFLYCVKAMKGLDRLTRLVIGRKQDVGTAVRDISK